eukprot:gnl/MRDRNA2_/MRDRNA2_31908_c0_seq1.p1 gnl/MRDRNA2_/MRDRNA2_31908_c0~~gnl/MRDRNA2_/MRDRNA2_31908_c0_seq1.p1  ORF type:complete len:416 (+),score=71.37 gnl/MRDRNA2_/MRDRNA2_31908_c0_seq1:181-1248(+)
MAAYLGTIPDDMDFAKTHPLYFSESRRACFDGSSFARRFDSDLRRVQGDFDLAQEEWAANFPGDNPLTWQEFRWAMAVVKSRSFGILLGSRVFSTLVPLGDLLNHRDPGRAVKWKLNKKSSSIEYSTIEPVQQGEELFTSYGERANSHLLLHYGFTVEGNPFLPAVTVTTPQSWPIFNDGSTDEATQEPPAVQTLKLRWESMQKLLRNLRWLVGQRDASCKDRRCETAADNKTEKEVLLGLLAAAKAQLSHWKDSNGAPWGADDDCKRVWRDDRRVWVVVEDFATNAVAALQNQKLPPLETLRKEIRSLPSTGGCEDGEDVPIGTEGDMYWKRCGQRMLQAYINADLKWLINPGS